MGAEEAERLEALWRGRFGVEYTERNARVGDPRAMFWRMCLQRCPAASVLEVGANLGANLRWLATVVAGPVVGIDVNEFAATALAEEIPAARAVVAAARALPFRSGSFDLVFTTGVLIHQPPETLPIVMGEIVRCARRWVVCGEYFAPEPTEVLYRGERGALFKRDFGGDYERLFPALRLLDQGFLRDAEWDDVTYWIFEKQ